MKRLRENLFLMLVFCVVSLGLGAQVHAQEQWVKFPEGTFRVFSNSSDSPSSENESFRQLVIVVHGSYKNAHDYYQSMMIASQMDSQQLGSKASPGSSETLVIAPAFKTPEDQRGPDELTYTDEGWLRGDPSLNSKLSVGISSFKLIDSLVQSSLEKHPNIRQVTITGHSAGGQLTQRYAISSFIEDRYPKVHFKYVVSNPGSYTYLSPLRPYKNINSTRPVFMLPFGDCSNYNDYKYGLDSPNEYVGQKAKHQLIFDYLKRKVIYLIGEKDTESATIDMSCEAKLQGWNRLERASYFFSFLNQFFPKQHNHELRVVPGVGHSQAGIYRSPIGVSTIFGSKK